MPYYIPLRNHLIDLEHTTIPLTCLSFMDPGKFAKFAIVWEVSACVRLYVLVTFC